jgi:hydroxymethylpyrimidine kinase / phosphomethylpyrimidine kinase / thiamine-phosphate diphosphorylase
MDKKVALSIAGSDSSGGAGIQADLKSFSYLGVHGMTALTCITAQNTQGVRAIHTVPIEIIESQIDSLFDDCKISAVKTGMLYNKDIVKAVASKLSTYQMKPVVDPVMIATSGDALSQPSLIYALKKELLPQALMVTANIPEACALADMNIQKRKDIQTACKTIAELGPKYVLIKGGHLEDTLVSDVVYDGKEFHTFILPRIPHKKAHGSGCTLSALITGLFALGEPPVDAVLKAKHIVWGMINEGYSPGKGADVLNHTTTIRVPPLVKSNERFSVWLELTTAIDTILVFLPPWFIPEVGMNFVYALPNATTRDMICAVDGRITKHKERPFLCGTVDFGVSKHVASIVLAAMSFDPGIRSAINIRYSQKTVDLCKAIGFRIGAFERDNEPPTASSTMEWGTNHAITKLGQIPDIIYDTGGVGKEPMIRVLGKNPDDIVEKLKKLVNASIS